MHVRARFDSDTIQQDAERVLRTLGKAQRTVRGNENGVLYMMRMLPYRTADNVISGVVMTFTDITRISAAEARIVELTDDLWTRIDELETILDLIPVGVMIRASAGSTQVMINSCGARLIHPEDDRKGLRPVATPFRLFEHGIQLPPERQPLERAVSTGKEVSSWEGQLQNQRGDRLHVMISAAPLFTEAGRVRGAVAAIVDITQQAKHSELQQFLLGELQHRVKNILATITSLATRMSRGQTSVEEFRGAFLGRLLAMGRTHDLLTEGAWSSTSLRSLLGAALEPHTTAGKDDIVLDGPDVTLAADTATTLGMIFRELATNASKYGGLSKAGGRVEISWRLSDTGEPVGQRLGLTWTEYGGPPVDHSRPSGFGRSFIMRSVEYELGGKANLDFAPDGLRCTIELPCTDKVAGRLPPGRM